MAEKRHTAFRKALAAAGGHSPGGACAMSLADATGGFGLHAILLLAGLILGLIVVTR